MRTLFFLLILFIFSCSGTDCNKLPAYFTSFSEACKQIENTQFNYKDEVNTHKSSWIKGAKYFSCDNQTGFFILTTDKQDYIYQNLPIDIWVGFKNASSFGLYYNANIKYRYQVQLTSEK